MTEGKWTEKNEKSLRDPWEDNKRHSIHVVRALEGEGKGGRAEKVLRRIMVRNFPNWAKDIKLCSYFLDYETNAYTIFMDRKTQHSYDVNSLQN